MEREEMFDWLHRKAAIVGGFPAPQGNPDGFALDLHRRGAIAVEGNREFREVPGVVFGVRGGMHMSTVSFGGEFDFEGDRWIATSHREHNKRRTTVVVGALRRQAVDALFDAGVFVDPIVRRECRERADVEAKIALTETYGLSEEAYGIARGLAERAAATGRIAPDQVQAETGTRLSYVAGLLRAADTWLWTDHLRPDNITSRAAFERLTGSRLPATLRDSQALLAAPPPAGFVAGRIAAMPPCRDAVMALAAKLADHVTRVDAGNAGQSYIRDYRVSQGIDDYAAAARAGLAALVEHGGGDPAIGRAFDAVDSIQLAVANARADGADAAVFERSQAHLHDAARRLRGAIAEPSQTAIRKI